MNAIRVTCLLSLLAVVPTNAFAITWWMIKGSEGKCAPAVQNHIQTPPEMMIRTKLDCEITDLIPVKTGGVFLILTCGDSRLAYASSKKACEAFAKTMRQ